MAGKVLELKDVVQPDRMAAQITDFWLQWDMAKQVTKERWNETRKYIFATDTTHTSNSQLPWNNKTTIPKLCQIRDNLHANYMASIFPRRKWLKWEADNEEDQDKDKTDAITSYMAWVIDQGWFKPEFSKIVLDYLDTGNCFTTVEWVDERIQLDNGKTQVGYVGPRLKRISPYDIVFNPIAPNFADSPKIVRSLVTMGEAKEILQRMSNTEDDKETAQALYDRMRQVRVTVAEWAGTLATDAMYTIDGFGSYKDYLLSGYCEVLYFYGDIYDVLTGEFYKNYQIAVMDRTHLAYKKPNPSFFGRAPIYHSGWRRRQDNLWAMGPLENLVGMQYRIDHIENMKADLFDLTAFPPIKRKGYVEDFEWGPMKEIIVGDDGDVELMTPQANIIQFSQELQFYLQMMEEMAGAPKEAMGFRSPGEKTMYEVQSLENAAGRIYQSKIAQIEEEQLEPGLNAMLELASRNMDVTVIRVLDDEYKMNVFSSLTKEDITGSGRIKPIAARHFAEKAELIQNITQLFSSKLGQMVAPNVSTAKLTSMVEDTFELNDWELFSPNAAITDEADRQKLINAHQEGVSTAAMTPAGIAQDDHSRAPAPPTGPMPQGAMPPGAQMPSSPLPQGR